MQDTNQPPHPANNDYAEHDIKKMSDDYADSIIQDVGFNNPNRNKIWNSAKADFESGYNVAMESRNDYAVKVIQEENDQLIGALKRLIHAAKPHCVETSLLNMRVNEAQSLLEKLKS